MRYGCGRNVVAVRSRFLARRLASGAVAVVVVAVVELVVLADRFSFGLYLTGADPLATTLVVADFKHRTAP